MGTTLTAGSTGASSDQEERLLSKLGKMWMTFQKKDLEIRHETGKLLNAFLDDPNKRQKYGAGTITKVSNEIGVSPSDISRMRHFARVFLTLEEFQKKHPGATTWSAVKELLPKKPKGKKKAPKTSPAAAVSSEKAAGQEEEEVADEVEADSSEAETSSEAESAENSDDRDSPQEVAKIILHSLEEALKQLEGLGKVRVGESGGKIVTVAKQIINVLTYMPR